MRSKSGAAWWLRHVRRSNRRKLTVVQRAMIPQLHARRIGYLVIAKALGVSRQTVRYHVRRARAR